MYKSYISCNRIRGFKVITVICLGSHFNDRSGVLIEKIQGCLVEYRHLSGNERLVNDLWFTKQNNSQILITEAANVGVPGNSCFYLPYD